MRRSLVLVLALCAAVLAGCGGEPEMVGNPPLPESLRDGPSSAGEITAMKPAKAATAAFDAVVKAGGVRIRTGRPGGQTDLRLSPGRAVGVLYSGSTRVDVRRVGSAVYVRSVPAYWQHTPLRSSAAKIGTSWVRFTRADNRDDGMLQVTDFSWFLGRMIDPDRWASWGERKSIRGTPAVGMRAEQKSSEVLYIARSGPPYPLLLAGNSEVSWEFLDFGKPAVTEVPAGAIDGDRLPAAAPL